MSPQPVTIYLGLGSNLGDRPKNLVRALTMLAPRVRIIQCSSVYDTAPQGNPHQPRFLNMVVRAETDLPPEHLLELAKDIEAELGRVSTIPNSPRPIDIDLLIYGQLIRQSPSLIIPHPQLIRRHFVLVPLAEIAPRLKHPVSQKTMCRLLKELPLLGQEVIKCEEIIDVQAYH
ncbi:MAG: 2-amino-4-hydroxy-6-hydroxymethyldihydropteridine diphosphokinase [Dehalococcoidia bacterium]|nr:2-amino-4-hydroxy-6-hydroxymethyldihydropteridine diphosphokinase [Dehalococcoidia bacterium]